MSVWRLSRLDELHACCSERNAQTSMCVLKPRSHRDSVVARGDRFCSPALPIDSFRPLPPPACSPAVMRSLLLLALAAVMASCQAIDPRVCTMPHPPNHPNWARIFNITSGRQANSCEEALLAAGGNVPASADSDANWDAQPWLNGGAELGCASQRVVAFERCIAAAARPPPLSGQLAEGPAFMLRTLPACPSASWLQASQHAPLAALLALQNRRQVR